MAIKDIRAAVADVNPLTGAHTVSAERMEATLMKIGSNATAGCGASDVLYTNRLCRAIDKLLNALPEDLRLAFLPQAVYHDYETAEQRTAEHERFEPGECGLTEIGADF